MEIYKRHFEIKIQQSKYTLCNMRDRNIRIDLKPPAHVLQGALLPALQVTSSEDR